MRRRLHLPSAGKLPPEQYADMRRARERDRAKTRKYNPDKHRRNWLKAMHGMTPGEYDALRDAQGGRCCYCERPLPEDTRQVHIDHDHSCTCGPKHSCVACRRGLACQNCNFVVGNGGDDPDRMEQIAANLRRLSAGSQARIRARPLQAELPINVVPLRAVGD